MSLAVPLATSSTRCRISCSQAASTSEADSDPSSNEARRSSARLARSSGLRVRAFCDSYSTSVVIRHSFLDEREFTPQIVCTHRLCTPKTAIRDREKPHDSRAHKSRFPSIGQSYTRNRHRCRDTVPQSNRFALKQQLPCRPQAACFLAFWYQSRICSPFQCSTPSNFAM